MGSLYAVTSPLKFHSKKPLGREHATARPRRRRGSSGPMILQILQAAAHHRGSGSGSGPTQCPSHVGDPARLRRRCNRDEGKSRPRACSSSAPSLADVGRWTVSGFTTDWALRGCGCGCGSGFNPKIYVRGPARTAPKKLGATVTPPVKRL
jgi:hypothetical protein